MEFDIGTLLDGICETNLPDPCMWQYYKNLTNNRIVLNQEIGDSTLEMVILPYLDMVKNPNVEEIEIILSTVGGGIYDGFNLVDILDKTTKKTTIHIMSMAASMGSYIAMAGHNNPNVRTVCHPFSVGLLHAGSASYSGSMTQIRDGIDFNKKYEDRVREYVLTHSNITPEFYDKIERKEYWMDSEEMLRLGIVDEII